jgi:hypothetical protein
LILEALPQDPPFIVEGIFHQGSKLVLAGSSKAGKTWSLIDLALSVASGRDWWGFSTNQCAVLYVNFEIQPPFFHRRVALIKEKRGIEIEPETLQIIHLRGTRLTAELFGRALSEKYNDAGYGLVILDPIYKLMVGKEENSTATISAVADVIDGIATSCNAAVAYGAHFSKGNQAGKDAQDRINGSGVAARDADSILTLTKHTEDDCASLEAVLRNCPPMEPKVMRWNFPLMEEANELDPADLKKPVGVFQVKYTLDQLLEVMGAKLMTAKEVERACFDAHGMSESAVRRLLNKGKEDGKVIQPSAGLWRRFTESRP